MDIAKYTELTALVSQRNKMVEGCQLVQDAIEKAQALGTTKWDLNVYDFSYKKAVWKIDNKFWRDGFNKTGLGQFFDAEARRELNKELEERHIEFTEENIKATYLRLAGDAKNMMNRGVYNIFKHLCGHYRTHDAFKIKEKMIVSCVVSDYSKSLTHGRGRDQLNDLDRAVKLLTGRTFKENEFTDQLLEFIHNNDYGSTFENEDFKFKFYRNGNAHIWLKDSKTIEAVNQAIIDYCGENTLANAS